MLALSIAEHERAMDGSAPEQVEALLGGMALAFPNSRVTDGEAEARLEIYGAALSDIPPDILKYALQQTVKTCKFFPTVAEIREIAAGPKAIRAWRLMAMKYMAAQHDRRNGPYADQVRSKTRLQSPHDTAHGERRAPDQREDGDGG